MLPIGHFPLDTVDTRAEVAFRPALLFDSNLVSLARSAETWFSYCVNFSHVRTTLRTSSASCRLQAVHRHEWIVDSWIVPAK